MQVTIISSALVAAIVGFGSTLALLIAASDALGATSTQAASWVSAICIAKFFETVYLSWRYRQPIITAWSTAGLALLGASAGFTVNEAVGAYIITGLLLILTGMFRPLNNFVAKIPNSISAGMLAGILLPFVIGAAKSIGINPTLLLPLVVIFFLVRLKSPALATLIVLFGGALLAILTGDITAAPDLSISGLEYIAPEFKLSTMIGLAIPLYLVTMASQNLPGIAVLKASGYEPPSGPIISVTGLFSTLTAFFGASTTNLAAITAAICTGPEAHSDPEKRWLTGPVYAVCYLIFAVFGASLLALFDLLPKELIALVAGLALLAPLANATQIAVKEKFENVAAVATFAVTASGIAFYGIGAAFWGLAMGLLILYLNKISRG